MGDFNVNETRKVMEKEFHNTREQARKASPNTYMDYYTNRRFYRTTAKSRN